MTRSARPTAVVAVMVALGAIAGCGVQGLNFVEDRRVRFRQPEALAEVRLPATIDWEVDGFDVTGPTRSAEPGAGYFAVLIDRSPQPPGESLDWFARNDASCVPARGCPNEAWLAQRGIHTTSSTSFEVDSVSASVEERGDLHEVTIILLDGSGRRIGESAFVRRFDVDRDR